MRYCFILVLIVFLASCSSDMVNQKKIIADSLSPKYSSAQNTETKFLIIRGDTGTEYFNVIDPVIFADTANVYQAKDSLSEVMTKISFNTPLKIRDVNSYWEGWYEIDLGNRNGFIPTGSVATHKFRTKGFDYLLVTGYSKKYNPNIGGFAIYKYDRDGKQFTDTFFVMNTRADIAKEMNHKAWKNAEFLLYAKQINAYCGGGETEIYIIDANNKFKVLFSTYSYIDDGECAGGYYANVSFPKNVAEDTIIYHQFIEEPDYTVKGKIIKNKDGTCKMKISGDTACYYRWNGKDLAELKRKIN